jgi:cytochrome c5
LKRILGLGLLMLMIGLISACGNDESSKEPASKPASETAEQPAEEATSDPATTSLAGDEVFQKSCITCHSSGDITGGQAKLDATKIHADFQKKEDLLGFVEKNMPKSAPGSLSKDEYQAVVDYLWDQK